MSVVVNGIEFEYLRNGPTLQNKNLKKDYILNQYINLFHRFKGIIDRAQCFFSKTSILILNLIWQHRIPLTVSILEPELNESQCTPTKKLPDFVKFGCQF
jgi:hypothetical protein